MEDNMRNVLSLRLTKMCTKRTNRNISTAFMFQITIFLDIDYKNLTFQTIFYIIHFPHIAAI